VIISEIGPEGLVLAMQGIDWLAEKSAPRVNHLLAVYHDW